MPELELATLPTFTLENGEVLRNAKIGYRVAGSLNAQRSNAILYPTWFMGTSEDLFNYGATDPIDTEKYFVIVMDALGNGVSSSPSNYPEFPSITIGDMVTAQHKLLMEILKVEHLHAVIGTSMGGMQTYEWLTRFPNFMDRAIPLVGSPQLGSYDRLLWKTQLEAIALARQGGNGADAKPLVGMIDALALHTPEYHARRTPRSQAAAFITAAQASGANDINNKAAQLNAMLAHDVSRNFDGSMEHAAAAVKARVLSIVDLQDHMVTPDPAIRFAALIGAESIELDTYCGHMTTFCEKKIIEEAVVEFLEQP
ncbi:alpha/beta fold hydrolase [Microbulbifer sp. YPW1]|uniref:alpha/beta fold hydrolase n=1 Tax=Microbulbifer sp. YPW1 TaxID=2745199 RepID=UPI001597968B|nr:alpha/beta fold hydrolase [Microbulbifer sp. YPW1]QKX17625.1 alpha/beta fold hydrolase [Microbulbifer sp. YPW1]